MKASLIAIVVSLSSADAFTPRNGLEKRVGGTTTSSETLLDTRTTTPLQQSSTNPEVARLPTTMKKLSPPTLVPNSMLEQWEPAENDTISDFSATMQQQKFERNQSKYFLNLPIEKDGELLTDQKIMGAVLKEPLIEVTSVFLVVLSSCLVALSTLNTVDLQTVANIIRGENVIACIFALEFVARWYSQFTWKGIFDYLLKPMVLIDIVVVILPLIPLLVPPASAGVYEFLPSWLFSSAGLVNLRLLRVLRLQRVLTDMDTFADFQMALGIPRTEVKPYKLELARVVLSLFTLLSISTGLIYSTEHAVNPNIPSYFDALYFTLTTLTTVGFGDITPQTPEGKLVVSGSILAGVAVIPAQAAALVEALLKQEEAKSGEVRMQKRKSRLAESQSSGEEQTSMALETTLSCSNCNARYHWASAEFCYACGSKLDNDSRK